MSDPLIIRPEAEADLAEAKDWYEHQRAGLGLEFILSLEECLERIRRSPYAHAEMYKGVRRTSIRRFPYGVYYRVEADAVVVLAVQHSRRDPRRWQERA
jgi:toxin ParE1/3/4